MPTRKLIEAVDGLQRVAFEGTSFRHLARGYLPLTGEGARIHGGRWNPPGSFSVLYTALDRATVVAELERSARRQGLSIRDFLPRDEVTYAISLQRVLDLGVASNRATLGLERSDIVGLDWAPCQAVGDAAHYVGFEAILAPSATSTGQTLALFLDRLVIGSRIDVQSVEDLAPVATHEIEPSFPAPNPNGPRYRAGKPRSARATFWSSFECLADPAGRLPLAERRRRAEASRGLEADTLDGLERPGFTRWLRRAASLRRTRGIGEGSPRPRRSTRA